MKPVDSNNNTTKKQIFFRAIILYGLVLYPIVRADRFYIDDLGRSLTGYLGWTKDGRPLANVVMEAFSLGTPLVDLTPLPQIFAMCMFAWLAVLFSEKYSLKGRWTAPLVLLPLIASPFFLENLSYKFDVVPMALAVYLAGMAALAKPTDSVRLGLGTLSLFVTLCLYQPALNVFLIFSLLEIVMGQWACLSLQRILRRAGARLAECIVATLFYAIVAAQTTYNAYASQHTRLTTLSSAVSVIWKNFSQSYIYAGSLLASATGVLLVSVILLGLVCVIAISFRYLALFWSATNTSTRIFMVFIGVMLPIALLAAAWGPMLLLVAPVLVPRTQIGIGALGVIGNVMVLAVMEKCRISRNWMAGFLIVTAYPLLLFASAYGNVLAQQKEYEIAITRNIADDFATVSASYGVVRFALKGRAERPPTVLNSARKYPILLDLVPVYLTEGWAWAEKELRHAGIRLDHVSASLRDIDRIKQGGARFIIRRANYNLYVIDDLAVIAFSPLGC